MQFDFSKNMKKTAILLALLMPACTHTANNDAQPETAATQTASRPVVATYADNPFTFAVEILNDNTYFPIKVNTSASGTVAYNINCDDDNIYEHSDQTEDSSCFYASKGTKIIKITGSLPGILLADSDNYQVTDIIQWGNNAWKTMENFSTHCSNLTISASDAPVLSQAKSLKAMFYGAKSLNSSINHWKVSSIENMSEMFQDASSFNQPLNQWDTSHVTNMESMFNNAESFNQDISTWNVSSVKNMTSMFKEALTFNQPLNAWNVSNVQTMDMMFSGAAAFNQPLEQWNVGNVENMEYLFFYATSFMQSLDSWELKKVKSVYGMFSGDNEYVKAHRDTITMWKNKYQIDTTNIIEKE